MTEILVNPIWRHLRWLPAFVLRRLFTHERMATLVDIDLRGNGDRLLLSCGEEPFVEIRLTVRNGSPMTVVLDRCRVDVWCEGRYLGLIHWPERVILPPGEKSDLQVQGLFGVPYGEHLYALDREFDAQISVLASLDSRVGWFEKRCPQISAGRPRYTNTFLIDQARAKQSL